MQKLSLKKQLTIVRLYLSGLSYQEINAKAGVSKGTVANVVADLRAGRILDTIVAGKPAVNPSNNPLIEAHGAILMNPKLPAML